MYLLNDALIEQYVNAYRGSSDDFMDIENFDQDMLQHTSYYFRLGAEWDLFDGDGDARPQRLSATADVLTIPPRGYVVVKSHEVFRLSSRILGIFGSVSALAARGLQMNNSAYLDPLFSGALTVGIENKLDSENVIRWKEKIGKVSFFDISDTYPIRVRPGSIQERTFKQRKPRRDDDPVHVFDDGET